MGPGSMVGIMGFMVCVYSVYSVYSVYYKVVMKENVKNAGGSE